MRMRKLPQQLQALLAPISHEFQEELAAFLVRLESGDSDSHAEAQNLSQLYQRAANWFEAWGDDWDILDHVDLFFVERVFRDPAKSTSSPCRKVYATGSLPVATLLNEYRRLAGLFDANFSSFERKRFVNLSHEANKAMNLNSYLVSDR